LKRAKLARRAQFALALASVIFLVYRLVTGLLGGRHSPP
jgi:hypothetical protein